MNLIDLISLISIITFFFLFLGRTIQMLIVFKINPLVIGKGKFGFNKIMELLLLVGLILWLYQSLTIILKLKIQIFPNFMIKQLIEIRFLQYIGLILIIIGLIIFLLSLISFGKSWRVGIDKKNPGKLVKTGIFKFSRNPIFLFMDIYFIGFTLVYTTLFFIFFSIITVLSVHYQILQEEKFLLEQYGNEYRDYKNKVRRYI